MILPLLLVFACSWTAEDDKTVIENRLRRASEVSVQEHVTGDTITPGAAPSQAASDEAQALAALGYVDEGEEVTVDRKRGTAELDATQAAGGLNVYTVGARAGAVAVNMEGEVVHRWDFAITDAWPGFSHPEVKPDRVPWRRVVPLDNGDLVGIWSGFGLARITAGSELVWGHWLPVHHDLHVGADGSVVTLVARERAVPELHPGTLIDDALVWLSPEGYPQRELSLIDAFRAYEGWQEIWDKRPVTDSTDIFHTNTVHVLDRDYPEFHPAFRAGHVLTSMRHLNAVALVDPLAERVVWAMQGPFSHQHDPQMAADGLWVFDNRGGRPMTSRMLKLSASGDILWRWAGDDEHRFYTKTCGHAQQLSNGNLMVVSSEQGVAYELTPDQQVVWSYHVPDEINGQRGKKRVSRFFAFERVEQAEGAEWLSPPAP